MGFIDFVANLTLDLKISLGNLTKKLNINPKVISDALRLILEYFHKVNALPFLLCLMTRS